MLKTMVNGAKFSAKALVKTAVVTGVVTVTAPVVLVNGSIKAAKDIGGYMMEYTNLPYVIEETKEFMEEITREDGWTRA